MYLVLVTVSVLFDIIKFAGLPSFDKMTSGEGFGATLWIFIFLLKPIMDVHAKKRSLSTKHPLRYQDLGFGEAGLIPFTPGKKPGQVVHPRLK